MESDPTFADDVASGKFDGEISFLIKELYPLISNECVKGRELYPVPDSVRKNEQRNESGSNSEKLRQWLLTNTRPVNGHRFGSNHILVDCALQLHFIKKIDNIQLKAVGVEACKGLARNVKKTTTLFRTHLWSGHDAAMGAKSLRLTDIALDNLLGRMPDLAKHDDGRKYDTEPEGE